MKKYTLLLSLLTLLTVTPSVYAIDIWAVAATNIHLDMGCDTIWFRMWSPIPTLENARGKVVEISTHFVSEIPGDTSNKFVPYPDFPSGRFFEPTGREIHLILGS